MRARCVIDHQAVLANLERFRHLVGDGVAVWPVVKADAYGHGAGEVAATLSQAGVPRMCVAAVSELEALRSAGIECDLLVMGPVEADSIGRVADMGGEIAVTHDEQIAQIVSAVDDLNQPLRVHLKVDTGMGRWGVAAGTAVDALTTLSSHEQIQVLGLMTHFASADVADSNFTDRQLATFQPIIATARELIPGIIVHAANSAAALRYQDAHFDAVRIGVGMYGLDPFQGDPASNNLRPAMSVTSRVAAIRTLQPGMSTGYGRRFVAKQPARIALVPIGYADGLRRLLGEVGEVVIGEQRYPIVSTVSMDHVSVLVDDTVGEGDDVVILGARGAHRVSAEDHATWASTINYEITCGIAGEPRLDRVHLTASHVDDSILDTSAR